MSSSAALTAQGALEWTLHGGQQRAFDSRAKYAVLVCGRRWGKTELLMMKLVSWVLDDYLMGREGVYWIVLPTYSLARPLYRKLKRILPESLITHEVGTEVRPDMIQVGPVTIEFKSADNPQRLVAEGLRGAVLDEAGIMKELAWTESILPTLIDHDAPAILGGTPKGRNWFHRMFVRGGDPLDTRVESFGGPSWENPFVPLNAIQDLSRDMSHRMLRQEILAEFLEDDGAVFRGHRSLVRALPTDPDKLLELGKRTHVLGVDLAKHQDFTVLHGLSRDGKTTYFDRFNQISWPLQKRRIIEAHRKTRAKVVLDATGAGDPIYDDLVGAGVPVIPFGFTNKSKRALVEGLSISLEQRELELPDEPVLLNELDIYEYEVTRHGNTTYNAPEGCHDDTVIALGLAKWGLTKRAPSVKDIGIVHF